jgi:hypothetical protein
MKPKYSLPCSQQPTIGPYPEPDESSPHINAVSLRFILILSSHLRLGLPSGLFPSGSPTNNLNLFNITPMRAICPAHSSSLILWPQ